MSCEATLDRGATELVRGGLVRQAEASTGGGAHNAERRRVPSHVATQPAAAGGCLLNVWSPATKRNIARAGCTTRSFGTNPEPRDDRLNLEPKDWPSRDGVERRLMPLVARQYELAPPDRAGYANIPFSRRTADGPSSYP
jgi:hypothetical protein